MLYTLWTYWLLVCLHLKSRGNNNIYVLPNGFNVLYHFSLALMKGEILCNSYVQKYRIYIYYNPHNCYITTESAWFSRSPHGTGLLMRTRRIAKYWIWCILVTHMSYIFRVIYIRYFVPNWKMWPFKSFRKLFGWWILNLKRLRKGKINFLPQFVISIQKARIAYSFCRCARAWWEVAGFLNF